MFKTHDLQMFGLKLNKYDILHQLQVLGHSSEIQLQLGTNLNKMT